MRKLLLCLLLTGCASTSQLDKPYHPKETYLRPRQQVSDVCNGSVGCSFFFHGSNVCQVYAWKDAPNLAQILRHENMHCNGYR